MRVPRLIPLFVIAAALCVLSACSWVGRYNDTAYQQLLTLKQLHLQFIATAATEDDQQLSEEDEQIRQQFAQAIAQGDALRQENFKLLEGNYLRVYAHRQMRGAPFTPCRSAIFNAADHLSLSTGYRWRMSAYREGIMPTTMEIRTLLSACAINSAEWMPLLNKVLGDEQREVRDSAIFLLQALQQKAQGWLTEDDLRLLLEGQRDIARIRANNQSIARQAQLQSTLLRLFDITLLALAGRL
ncbi:hypothetical protein [Klebsiella aerogenes]